ncbi:MAG: hypothetical protein ACO3JL_16010, partial [Myxococcota bacterium]
MRLTALKRRVGAGDVGGWLSSTIAVSAVLCLASPAPADNAPAEEAPARVATRESPADVAKRQARTRCGCAGPRFLRSSSSVVLGPGDFVAAWLPVDRDVTLGASQRDADGTLTTL